MKLEVDQGNGRTKTVCFGQYTNEFALSVTKEKKNQMILTC